jgi:hypothetical protein
MEIHTKAQEVGGLIPGEELIFFKLYNQGKSCACKIKGTDSFKVIE